MKRDAELNDTLAQVTGPEQEMWLLGQAPLRKYLDFVEDLGYGPKPANRTPLVEEWSAAAAWYEQLAQREPGIADKLDCRELDPVLAPLAEEILFSDRFKRTFDHLPVRLAMVEIAHLVVCQTMSRAASSTGSRSAWGRTPSRRRCSGFACRRRTAGRRCRYARWGRSAMSFAPTRPTSASTNRCC